MLWICWEVRPEGPFLSALGGTAAVVLSLKGRFTVPWEFATNGPCRTSEKIRSSPRASPWADRNGLSGRTSQKIQSKNRMSPHHFEYRQSSNPPVTRSARARARARGVGVIPAVTMALDSRSVGQPKSGENSPIARPHSRFGLRGVGISHSGRISSSRGASRDVTGSLKKYPVS